ncbi:GAF domain-containing protein [Hymenobacter aquaticus]|nr:GAF domain-containing protein [Hymenobacter aquaticus]
MNTPSHLLSSNEPQRLAALQAYQVSGDAPFFDEFVRLTGKLFQVPIALVSLVEADTVWFRGNAGLDAPARVPRSVSLCSAAILSDEATVFEDLHQQPCSLVAPTAVEALGLRFYAGYPLHTSSGEAVGTLCVIDRQPRTLAPEELALLPQLAAVALQLLDVQVELARQRGTLASLWPDIYQAIAGSLSRLDTLVGLAQWEESPDTPAARAYQASRREEASLLVSTLQQQLAQALRQLRAAG